MSIIQISSIKQRIGNLVNLPQLAEAQFGWAKDAKRLFIGKASPNENVEVLTSYSYIDFSQINGAVGNLNISNTAANGQPLVYDGADWVNRGGNAGGLITLGNVSNVQITGGAIGYVLETDGVGNLSWTPKGTLYTHITALSNANPIVMTVANTTPYVNDSQVTITGANGVSNSIVNGQTFYVRLAGDYPTSGNVSLYTSSGASGPVNGAGLTYTNSPNAIATSSVSASGGAAAAGGSNTTVQFNASGLLDGSSSFTWNNSTNLLSVSGNANIGNVSVSGVVTSTRFISNVATGTSPLSVQSTTRVANLSVAYANVADYEVVTAQTTGTFYPVFVSGNSTANYALGANSGLSFAVSTGTLSSTLLNGRISVTAAAQPNITSVGTLTSVSVSGNANVGNLGTAGLIIATGNITGGNVISSGVFSGNGSSLTALAGANVTGQVANALVAGTVYTAAQPNITSVGTLSSATVTANVTTGGIKTDNYYYANGVAVSFTGTYSNTNVAAYLPTYTGQIGTGAATHYGTTLTTGANSTAGTITGNWTLSTGSKMQATYADLAEYYDSDELYEPGTVVEFGGEYEITLGTASTTRVAGVVSTNPAYIMNVSESERALAIALQGRVPCKVTGQISKGDMLVSAGNGIARAENSPILGSIIGKSLENFDGLSGTIEVVVGRL